MSKAVTEFAKTSGADQKRPNFHSHIPWEHNWDDDRQTGNQTVEEYVEIAKELSPLLVERVKQMVKAHAPDAEILIDNLVKKPESATRKLSDEDIRGIPSRIGDYLRAKIMVGAGKGAAEQIDALREEAITSPDTTSYRDNFRRPCPEGGHAGFKFHMLIESGGKSIKAEIQIAHVDMERGPRADAVHALRDSERSISPLVKSQKATQLNRHWGQNIKDLYEATQSLRRGLNQEIIREAGLTPLLDPDLRRMYEFNKGGLTDQVTQSLTKDMGRKMVGPTLVNVIDILPRTSAFGHDLSALVAQNKLPHQHGHFTR